MHAEKKANAFVEPEAAIRALQSAEEIPDRIDKARQTIAERPKSLLDYVIRGFTLSSARLNKPQGLDLR